MLVPRTDPNIFNPNDALAIDLSPEAIPVAAPGAGEVVNAAFRQENLIGSLIARQTAGGPRDPDYNPWDDIKGTPYEEYWQRFAANAWNPGQTAALKRQIDMELDDRNTLAAAGGWGILATMGAGIFSPENLIPGGTVVRGLRLGQAVLRTALSTASAAAIGAAAAEVGLQATQETRTPLESAFNVGGAAMLGGALGAGLSAAFVRSDFARLANQFEQEGAAVADTRTLFDNEQTMLVGAGTPGSAGAAARQLDSMDDLSIAGLGAQIAGAAAKGLNPILRILHSPSAIVRDVGTRLFENPIYLKKNMEGIASTPGVETLVKQYTQGALARAVGTTKTMFGDYRKAGGHLDRLAFNEAVGRAMRRSDADENPLIAKTAQAWRKDVFDPLKDRAIEAGLLPQDVTVDTALSYFTRVYNRPMIEAREAQFKGIVRRYIDREVRNLESRMDVAKLDPRYDAPKTEVPGFVNDADRRAYVEEIVNSVYNTITGRNVDGDIPRDIVPIKRGPMKERTFHIPDTEIEEFLESNVEAVGRRYARTMAADVELTTAFGKADLKEQIEQIRGDYEKMRAAVDAGHDPATGAELPKALTAAQKAKEIERLIRAEKNDIRDLEALRDMLRGTYKVEENTTNFARAARVAGTINYLRALGGVTISSLGDVARHVMVHGLTNVMQDGLVPLISNLKSFKLSVEEAKIAGAVTERLLNTRMATWAEISDPYSVSSPFERFMENTAAGFSRLNGMVYWNDFQKAFASVITQNRVLRGTGDYSRLGKREKAYLAYLGIDGSMAERIARQFQAHGTIEPGNVRVAHSDDWTDEIARRTYRAAILKDVDTTIVTKGVGDVPLFMNTPLGRLAGQFKGFALASHQRVLMRGLQERPMGFVSGSMIAATMGMMIYYLKSVESNRIEDISDNPGRWIAEGLDRSGIFSIAFEVNNTVERHFGIGAYGALMAAFPGSQEGTASRYLSRSAWATVGGPTADLIDTILAAGNAIKGTTEGWTEGEINSIRRLVPGASLPGIRTFVEYVGMPAAEQALN